MNTATFYSSARRVITAATLAEANELATRIENFTSIVFLSPKAGDQSNQASYNKEFAQDKDFAFEPTTTLEVEEDVLVDDILDASASTSDAAVDDISVSNNDLSTPNQLVKNRKTTSKKQ